MWSKFPQEDHRTLPFETQMTKWLDFIKFFCGTYICKPSYFSSLIVNLFSGPRRKISVAVGWSLLLRSLRHILFKEQVIPWTILKNLVMKLGNYLMMMIMKTAMAFSPFQIPHRYCVVKNCHLCFELLGEIKQLEQSTEEFVCFTLLQQRGCCEHYLRRSKGYQF